MKGKGQLSIEKKYEIWENKTTSQIKTEGCFGLAFLLVC